MKVKIKKIKNILMKKIMNTTITSDFITFYESFIYSYQFIIIL